MGTIWDAVVSNKDLDLPTQQELLAQFRCGELAAAAFSTFAALVSAFPPAPPAGQLDSTLGSRMLDAKQAALVAYDTAASRYHPAVYARQRAELVDKVHSALAPLFATQLKSAHKGLLRAYRVEIEEALKGDGYDFARVVTEARARAERSFEEEAKRVTLEESGWSAEEERIALGEDMDSVAELLRKEETRKMVAVIEVRLHFLLCAPSCLLCGTCEATTPRTCSADAFTVLARSATSSAKWPRRSSSRSTHRASTCGTRS